MENHLIGHLTDGSQGLLFFASARIQVIALGVYHPVTNEWSPLFVINLYGYSVFDGADEDEFLKTGTRDQMMPNSVRI